LFCYQERTIKPFAFSQSLPIRAIVGKEESLDAEEEVRGRKDKKNAHELGMFD